MTPEKIVQNEIVNYLKKREKNGEPIFVERRNAGGFSYKKGVADLYASIYGKHVEIEVKRPGGSQSPLQELWQRECEQKYQIPYICAYSIDNFKEQLEALHLGGKE